MAPFKFHWFKGGTLAKIVSSGTGYIELLKDRNTFFNPRGNSTVTFTTIHMIQKSQVCVRGKSQEKIEVHTEGKLPRNMIPFIQIAGSFMCK